MREVLPIKKNRTLGVAVVGFGGAVSSTVAAGLALMRAGRVDTTGLPLGDLEPGSFGLVRYDAIELGGWDLCSDDLATAALHHRVLAPDKLEPVLEILSPLRPWPAVGDVSFCRNIAGEHRIIAATKRAAVEQIREDLRRFRGERDLDNVVMLHLASTERCPDPAAPELATIEAFEAAVDASSDVISPAMLYAYAAVLEGVAYGNFTPSLAAEIPALTALARKTGAPLAGRDGKTGQTFMKTVIAPALRDRALRVNGWYSVNILGNRDGQALEDPGSLASKLSTKRDVLDSILGYPVPDHKVRVDYYRPRGDEKEAWDSIDITGFAGERMQIKVNFLCRDSILAAPLVIEIARCLDLARRRGESGPIEPLGVFFKAPMTVKGPPLHAFVEQQARFRQWLEAGPRAAGR